MSNSSRRSKKSVLPVAPVFLADCKLTPFAEKKDDWRPGVFLYKEGGCRALNLTNMRMCDATEVNKINFVAAKGNKLYPVHPGARFQRVHFQVVETTCYGVLDRDSRSGFFTQVVLLESTVLQMCKFLAPSTVLLFASQSKGSRVPLVYSLWANFPSLTLRRGKNEWWHKTYGQVFASSDFLIDSGEKKLDLMLLHDFCDKPKLGEKFFGRLFSECLLMEYETKVNFFCLEKFFSLGFSCPKKHPHELMQGFRGLPGQGIRAASRHKFPEIATFLLENGAKPIYHLTQSLSLRRLTVLKGTHYYTKATETFARGCWSPRSARRGENASWKFYWNWTLIFLPPLVEIVTAFLPWWSVVELTPVQQRMLKVLKDK